MVLECQVTTDKEHSQYTPHCKHILYQKILSCQAGFKKHTKYKAVCYISVTFAQCCVRYAQV